jgi:hypothetical protein
MSKVALLKYSERLPHRKIEELLKRDYGLDITSSAIFEMTNRVTAQRVKEAEKLKDALYRLYHSITNHSPPEEERSRIYRNVISRLRYWLKKDWKVPFVLTFIKKLKSALPHLFTFILNPKVEPTNNRAERGLREHVVIRKIIGTL